MGRFVEVYVGQDESLLKLYPDTIIILKKNFPIANLDLSKDVFLEMEKLGFKKVSDAHRVLHELSQRAQIEFGCEYEKLEKAFRLLGEIT